MNDPQKNITPFNGTKYSVWRSRVRALIDETILAENALSIISQPNKPQDISDEEWLKRNKIAKGIIIRNLSDSLVVLATNPVDISAYQILNKLDNLYMRKSLQTELSMEMKLLTLRFDESKPLQDHLNLFDEMLSDLQAASGEKLKETNIIARLLSTLPKSYSPLVIAIQTITDENLSLPFVKIRLLEHEIAVNKDKIETSNKVLQIDTNNSQVHPSKYQFNKNHNNNYNRNHNNNYNKNHSNNYNNHKYRNMNYNKNYNINRNQQLYKQRNKFVKSNKTFYNKNIKCDYCGRKKHSKQNCFYKPKINDNSDQTQVQTAVSEEQAESFVFMCDDQNIIKQSENIHNTKFFLDSGATDHVINTDDIFDTVEILKTPIVIKVAKKDVYITATKRGTIQIITNHGVAGTLKDVLYAPEIPYNILSVRRIQGSGMRVTFLENGEVTITKANKTLVTCKSENNLITAEFTLNNCIVNQVKVKKNLYKLWHARLGHLDKNKFLEIKRNSMFSNNNKLDDVNPIEEICEACIYGKQARLPFSKIKDKSYVTRPLFIIHSDICGPITPPTLDNKSYFVTFIDQFTHYTVVYLLNRKSDIFVCFQDFVRKSESHHNLKIAHIYCDNGREYLSNEFREFCVEKGIQYHLTVPYTPQQNSVAERMNRSLVEKARTLLNAANLTKELWGEAILTATFLINITPTNALEISKTPYELWHNRKPRLENLKVFGSTAYIHDKTRKSKFDKKSIKGILVGYQTSGYKILIPDSNKFVIARDVIFDEINFKNSRPLIDNIENQSNSNNFKRHKIDDEHEINEVNDSKTYHNIDHINKHDNETEQIDERSLNNNPKTVENGTILRKSARIQDMPPISYNEETCYQISAQFMSEDVPNSYNEIKFRKDKLQWENAMKDEINSLIQNKTWELVPCPKNKNIIDCRWVYKIKNDININKAKYKARLVARGFTQKYLLDFDETFAPVVRITTVRIILAVANQFNLLIHQMDVKTAFLNGKLKEEIYMRVPEGIQAKDNYVCKLNKALYGLKQAARSWFQLFDDTLKKHNFVNSSADRCLYILDKQHMNKNIYVILYVDDILICTYDYKTLVTFKSYLQKQFEMVDMGEAKNFLGINIIRTSNSIILDQSKYLENILKTYKMKDCNPVSTPLPPKLNFEALNSNENYEAPCKNLIGCLMYAMLCTRPDLCTALNFLSRYQIKNNKELWLLLKRVLRYIKGSLDIKLVYKREEYKNMLIGYVDADWAGNENDRRSTTGYLFKIFDKSTISWNTKRQNSVAGSSTEAEYMALYEAAKEACWLKYLLKDIKLELVDPITIYEDNNSCIAIANNPTDHKRSKHIDVKYHFTREKIENKEIILVKISTGDQLADIFTKSLPAAQFQKIRDDIGLKAVKSIT